MKGVFSPVGTYIPGKKITLAKGVIRGVESNGMLCSAAELELSDDHDGIIELPADAPVGVAYARFAGLDDPVIDVGRDAEPSRRDRRRRHRARPRGGGPWPPEDAGAQVHRGGVRLPDRRPSRFRPRRQASLPCVRLAARPRRDQRPFARMDAEAAARDWPQADQRPRRHHQLHHLRPRPPAARVRLSPRSRAI